MICAALILLACLAVALLIGRIPKGDQTEQDWRPFSPYPGFDPCDGEEPGVRLSRDNPCLPARERDGAPGSGPVLSYHAVEVAQ